MLDLATVLFGLARSAWTTNQIQDLAAEQREQLNNRLSELLLNMEKGEFQAAQRALQDARRSRNPQVELTAALTHFQSAEQLACQAATQEFKQERRVNRAGLNHLEQAVKASAFQIRVYQYLGNPEMMMTCAGRFRTLFKGFYTSAHEWAGSTDSPSFDYYKQCRKGANELLEDLGLKKIKKAKDDEPDFADDDGPGGLGQAALDWVLEGRFGVAAKAAAIVIGTALAAGGGKK